MATLPRNNGTMMTRLSYDVICVTMCSGLTIKCFIFYLCIYNKLLIFYYGTVFLKSPQSSIWLESIVYPLIQLNPYTTNQQSTFRSRRKRQQKRLHQNKTTSIPNIPNGDSDHYNIVYNQPNSAHLHFNCFVPLYLLT